MSVKTLNKVLLIGNIVKKPELYQTKRGISVSTFNIITDRQWISNNQERTESTKHTCIAWDRLAEICVNILDKGSLVFIEGRLTENTFKDMNGNTNSRMEIVVNKIINLDDKQKFVNEFQESENRVNYH